MIKTPDKWVIVRLTTLDNQKIDKVLASWYGGYLGSDEWRMSSGIKGIDLKLDENDQGLIIFKNYSGSEYYCYTNCEGMSGYTTGIFNTYVKRCKEEHVSIEIIPYKDWKPLYV